MGKFTSIWRGFAVLLVKFVRSFSRFLGWDKASVLFALTATPIGGHAQKIAVVMPTPEEQVIYTFTGYADGGSPMSPVVLDSKGNIYGVTELGGSWDAGTVFEVSPAKDGWNETVLHNCGTKTGGDGISPMGQLIGDAVGNLYGTTASGGNTFCTTNQCGTVLKLSHSSGETGAAWAETLLHSFHGYDGEMPVGGVIFDRDGNLWGTTSFEALGWGTVFVLVRSQNWKLHTIHAFTGGPDGGWPQASLSIDANGNIWGTTTWGGSYGYGTVFQVTKPTDQPRLLTIHEFTGGSDGGSPMYGQLIFDRAGNIYGTTFYGGAGSCTGDWMGCGVVFELQQSGGSWNEKVLYSFGGSGDGRYPAGGLAFDGLGRLYGTTSDSGELSEYGNVFRLTQANGEWRFEVVYKFDFIHGATPYAGLTFDGRGNLYGTTSSGGRVGAGTVFEISSSQSDP